MSISISSPPINASVLSAVLRRYFQTSDLRLEQWKVQPLQHGQVIKNTEGLLLFTGTAMTGGHVRPWSMVAKIIAAHDSAKTRSEWFHALRESIVYQSGLLHSLNGLLSAPRCYGITRGAPDKTWIWLEYIPADEPSAWTIENFEQAAFGLGEYNARMQSLLPAVRDPTLSYSFITSWCNYWLPWYDLDKVNSVWKHPAVMRSISEGQRRDVLHLRCKVKWYIDQYTLLPKTFCHHDSHRLNLILPRDSKRVIAIDWALAGPGPLGSDASDLVAGSLVNFCFDPKQADLLEKRVLARYIEGLRSSGWVGEPAMIYAGYLLHTVLRFETLLPGWIALWLDDKQKPTTQQRYRLTEQQIASSWSAMLDFVIERRKSLLRLLSRD